jgi:threonylcarbamoyladenosine tRNA methylthiotransferase MtaB
MKRRHLRADALRLVERVRAVRPDMAFGADLIAGFPTESEEAALNSLRLLDDCDIVAAHIFPFSPRPNTPAARMPQVDRHLSRARAARLREAAAKRRAAWLRALVGSRQRILVENGGLARAPDHTPIAYRGEPGTLVRLTPASHDGRRLSA